MKVTLLYVGVGVAGFNDNRLSGDREGSWIGHGIASVGASIKKAGYEVNLIDMRQLAGYDDLYDVIGSSDVYGLSVSAVDYYPAMRVTKIIRETNPEAKILIGGIHPTIFPDKYDFADTVVVGEGEITAVDLIGKVERGDALPKKIKGVKPDLNDIPWVNRGLFNYERELECWFTFGQECPSITMLAGRGCAFKCSYCQPAENAVFGTPYRMRSPENVIAELVYLKEKYKYKSITFWDDTFTFSKSWINNFCDLYEKEKIGVPIVACSRADIICNNEAMVERLAEIGLEWFVIGMESGSQRMLDFIKKGTTVEQNIKSAEICKKYGIKVFATHMFGLPTETEEEAQATADMIDKINPEVPSPFWFSPIDGTDIHTYCKDNDLIINSGVARTATFVPRIKGVNYEHIIKLMNRGVIKNVKEISENCVAI